MMQARSPGPADLRPVAESRDSKEVRDSPEARGTGLPWWAGPVFRTSADDKAVSVNVSQQVSKNVRQSWTFVFDVSLTGFVSVTVNEQTSKTARGSVGAVRDVDELQDEISTSSSSAARRTNWTTVNFSRSLFVRPGGCQTSCVAVPPASAGATDGQKPGPAPKAPHARNVPRSGATAVRGERARPAGRSVPARPRVTAKYPYPPHPRTLQYAKSMFLSATDYRLALRRIQIRGDAL